MDKTLRLVGVLYAFGGTMVFVFAKDTTGLATYLTVMGCFFLLLAQGPPK